MNDLVKKSSDDAYELMREYKFLIWFLHRLYYSQYFLRLFIVFLLFALNKSKEKIKIVSLLKKEKNT